MLRAASQAPSDTGAPPERAAKYWIPCFVAVIAVAIFVNAPSLDFGWFGDDYAHRRFILDHLHGAPSRVAFWNMFDWRDLANRDEVDAGSLFGRLPWWAAPDFSFALLRPLSTLSHFLDYLLWPAHPWLMHLHNVALYCIVVALSGLLYHHVYANGLWALVPAVLFAIDDAHIVSTAWIASRNTLLTAAFVQLALLLYVRGAEGRTRSCALWLGLSVFCAHACSEGAIAVWAYLIAYALTLDPRPIRDKLLVLLPAAAVTVCVVTVSAVLGYGVHGSAVYVDPRSAPGLFASLLAPRMLELLRLQLSLAPELTQTWPNALSAGAQGISFVHMLLLAALVLFYVRGSRRVRFFALATIGALLPQCAAGSFSRLLLLSGFAAHGLVFAVGYELWTSRARPVWSRALLAVYACTALVIHGAAALDAPRHALAFSSTVDRSVSDAAASLPAGKNLEGEHIFVLNFPDYLRSVFIDLYRRELYGPGPRFMDVLGVTPARVQLTRVTENTIELVPDGGYLLEPSTMLVRTPSDVFQAGSQYKLSNLTLQIMRVTSDGRPAVVHVSGATVADDAGLWFRWDALQQRFVRMRLPAVGTTVWLDSNVLDLSSS